MLSSLPDFAPDDLSAVRPAFEPVGDAAGAAAALDVLGRHWGHLGPPGERVLVAVVGGAIRKNLLVELGGDKYILKSSPPSDLAVADRLREERDLEELLRAGGVPVPDSVASGSGEYVIDDGGRTWVLHRFVAGRHFTGAARELEQAAEALAAIVAATVSMPVEVLPRELDQLESLHLTALERPPWDAVLAEERDRTAAALAAVARVRPALERNPRVVHVDLHPANLLFDGEQLVCVLDLEDVITYDPVAAAGFSAYKLIRQMLAGEAGAALEGPALAHRWLAGWETLAPTELGELSAGDLRLGAERRVLALIESILSLYLDAPTDRLVYELAKQVRALREMDAVFGPRPEGIS